MHSSPASQAYGTSVVNVHSNIPTHDFTTETETKEESKQDARTIQLTKHLASNSSRAKAANKKAPTIVLPIITAPIERLDGTGEQVPLTERHAPPDKAAPRLGKTTRNDTLNTVRSRPIARSNDLLQRKSPRSASQQQDNGWHQVGRGPEAGVQNDLLSPEEKGSMAGNSIHLVQVEPIVSRDDSSVQTNLLRLKAPSGYPDKDAHVARTVGCAMALTKTAEGGEAASAQAVKRGHQVQMEEIPNDEDDTSFRQSQKTNLIPPIALEVAQSMVAELTGSSAKTEKVPHKWLRSFRAEWTLRGIKEARTESEAKAILKNWVHRA